MFFEGTGARFVTTFRERIHHILEAKENRALDFAIKNCA
jgi:hypothetical protein